MTITNRIDAITLIPSSHLKTVIPPPKSVKIELTGRCNYRCLSGDTTVQTIDGNRTLKDIYQSGVEVSVLTYRRGEVFYTRAVGLKTSDSEPLVRVHFTDGTSIDCTPDHKFLCFRTRGQRPGTEEFEVAATDLVPGARIRAVQDCVMPNGRVSIQWGRGKIKQRARLKMAHLLGRPLSSRELVHHLDGDPSNDHPSNLEVLTHSSHSTRHPEISERMRTDNPQRFVTAEGRANGREKLRRCRRSLEQRLRYRESKLGRKNPNWKHGQMSHKSRVTVNHRVASVEPIAPAPTYCLTVPETNWFFANNVLVHNCSFCALAVRDKQPTRDMSLPFFKRITKEMRDAGVLEIGVFFIGESFMAPDLLVSAIHYLKHEIEMPYVFLTSNGSLAHSKVVADVMRSGLDSLKWSVNSSNEEDFARVMKVKPSLFWKSIENIKQAHIVREYLRARTGLYASSIVYDGEQQGKMQSFLEEHIVPYVDQHYWLPLYSMGSFATAREEALGYRPTAGNQGRIGALRDPLPCWSVFTEGHVTSAGHLSACCFDASDNWSMANLHETPFLEAWNSSAYQELRRRHLEKDVTGTACEKCAAYQG